MGGFSTQVQWNNLSLADQKAMQKTRSQQLQNNLLQAQADAARIQRESAAASAPAGYPYPPKPEIEVGQYTGHSGPAMADGFGGGGSMYEDAQKAQELNQKDFEQKGNLSQKWRDEEFNKRQQAMEAAQDRRIAQQKQDATNLMSKRDQINYK